ncbi:hypothetical protein C9374_005963 [Naegleria lovaniensis]|uniref:Uncharacterized protein n=1 Tax=Naegleria lovaniensis TaxID=51637 RepID=A0AA88GM95_NAELO|nr:uncharacterized protein C9374_005963 [Naegleria lovaniensis]KAG2381579.1 hypothetical protein C9374_005963 [Naegleria lovaniensis]
MSSRAGSTAGSSKPGTSSSNRRGGGTTSELTSPKGTSNNNNVGSDSGPIGGFANREEMIAYFSKEKITPNLSPLSDYTFIHGCMNKKENELLEYLSKQLGVADYLVDLRSSIYLDSLCHYVAFCKEHSFSTRQTMEFINLMETLRKGCLSSESSNIPINTVITNNQMPTVAGAPKFSSELELQEFVKTQLFEMSKPLSQEQVSDLEKQIQDEERKLEEERLKQEKEKKKKPPSSSSSSKKMTKDEEEELLRKQEEEQRLAEEKAMIEKKRKEEYRSKLPLFNIDDVAIVSDFILKTVVQHYHLYKYVYEENQPVQACDYQVSVNSIMLDCVYPLSAMLQDVAYMQKKEDERRALEEAETRRRQAEEEERLRLENEARERYEKEKAERNAPKLTDENLKEIAEYLKHEVMTGLEDKVSVVETRVKATEETAMSLPTPQKSNSRPQSSAKTK